MTDKDAKGQEPTDLEKEEQKPEEEDDDDDVLLETSQQLQLA